MAKYKNITISHEFLDYNPDAYFVFGDNLIRQGYGGAAMMRDHPHALGFITKKYPDDMDNSFYRPDEYSPIFFEELGKLKTIIQKYPNKTFYISQLGAGLANKFRIWENLIHSNIVKELECFDNVIFCWDCSI